MIEIVNIRTTLDMRYDSQFLEFNQYFYTDSTKNYTIKACEANFYRSMVYITITQNSCSDLESAGVNQ